MWRPTVGIVPAGSLIFVVVVAVWAAFLLQHWVRRQDGTVAARAAERYSKAVRILERPSATIGLEPAAGSSHGGSPPLVGRPAGEVLRPAPAEEPRRSPLVARSSTEAVPDSHEVDPMPHQHQHHRSTAPPTSLGQRRLRAFLLLAAVLWVPASVVLVVLGRLLWISIPFSVLTVVAVVVWLRTEATAGRSRGSGDDRRHALDQPVLSSDDTQVIRPESVIRAAAEAASTAGQASAGRLEAPAPAAHAWEEVFDLEAALSQPVPVSQPDPADGTWAPVPVPRPTYAMKAKAEPRMTPGGVPADVFDTPEFAEEAEELDERARFARRAVSQ